MPSSNLVARKINQFSSSLFASPRLFENCPVPKYPTDLLHVPTVRVNRNTLWKLQKGAEEVIIAPRSRVTANSISLLTELAIAGVGVSELGTGLGGVLVEQGLLVRVLPDWQLPSISVYAVTASKDVPTRVTLFIDFLLTKMQSRIVSPPLNLVHKKDGKGALSDHLRML